MPDIKRKQHASERTGKLKRRGGSPEVPRSEKLLPRRKTRGGTGPSSKY